MPLSASDQNERVVSTDFEQDLDPRKDAKKGKLGGGAL